jgi:hypothetical protein
MRLHTQQAAINYIILLKFASVASLIGLGKWTDFSQLPRNSIGFLACNFLPLTRFQQFSVLNLDKEFRSMYGYQGLGVGTPVPSPMGMYQPAAGMPQAPQMVMMAGPGGAQVRFPSEV